MVPVIAGRPLVRTDIPGDSRYILGDRGIIPVGAI